MKNVLKNAITALSSVRLTPLGECALDAPAGYKA